MGCECKDGAQVNVPYIVYEGEMARHERRDKRLWVVIILLIVALVATNAMWLYEWCQYDYVSTETTTTYQQDGEGVNIIGDGNEAHYGAKEDGH